MAIERMWICDGMEPDAEQLKELEMLEGRPVVPDEDCPVLTTSQLDKIAMMARKRSKEHDTDVLSIRLSHEAHEKAKALGDGYLSIISRLVENALNNPAVMKQCM